MTTVVSDFHQSIKSLSVNLNGHFMVTSGGSWNHNNDENLCVDRDFIASHNLPSLEGVLLDLAGLLTRGAVQLPVVVLRLSQLVGGGGVLVVLGRRVPYADGNADDDDTTDNANADNGWCIVDL